MPLLGASFKKLLQRKAYDIVCVRFGFLATLIVAGLLVATGFLFGEAAFAWSSEKYTALFNSYRDNLAGKSFQSRLCSPIPIDVVYTWVNGSDPRLLAELRLLKAAMEAQLVLNVSINTSIVKCTYAHCVPANAFVLPNERLSGIETLEQLQASCEQCTAATKLSFIRTDDLLSNITVVYYDYDANFSATKLGIGNSAYNFFPGYYTSDLTVPNSVLLRDTLLVSGFKQSVTRELLEKQLPESVLKLINKMQVFDSDSVAVVTTPNAQDAATVLGLFSNLTFQGHHLTVNLANLVYSLSYVKKSEDISASRYEDNEELRYSLRSLEKHAPWIRHVYVVTNGQIPFWLNLENPRVSIVTHEEIFPNKSHLPTFSSPAIESHLHRIPGLSEKFIYMNDDVMFGQVVWPDDFFTHSKGQKVYLTWSIPDCSPGCPQSWIRDGYCDKPCNNSACQWDGGDCDGGKQAFGYGGGGGGAGGAANNWHDNWLQNSAGMCRTGCSNHWIADKYCDQTCNVKECGYDAGDCGVSNFHNLPMYLLSPDETEYGILRGDTVSYFNTSSVFQRIDEAHYVEDRLLRVSAVSNKYKVMTIILYNNQNTSTFFFNLTGKSAADGRSMSFGFSVTVQSNALAKKYRIPANGSAPTEASEIRQNVTQEPSFQFEDVAENDRAPMAATVLPVIFGAEINENENITLPASFHEQVKALEKLLQDGLLTMRGYKLKRSRLMREALLGRVPANQDGYTAANVTTAPTGNGPLGAAHVAAAAVTATALANAETQAAVAASAGSENGHASRRLLSLTEYGFLPWERAGTFDRLMQDIDSKEAQLAAAQKYVPALSRGTLRHLLALDTFAESLHRVNRLYNAAFGYASRKVIGHIAHMIDRHVMEDLQQSFPEEWATTSAHKIRSGTDMQYSFAYFHFLMGAKRNSTLEEFVRELDRDGSGILSDRELRTFATRVFEAPLDLQSLVTLEQLIINCSRASNISHTLGAVKSQKPETYYDTAMPQVTLELLRGCESVMQLIHKKLKPLQKYKFETTGEEEITFKMIGTNLSIVIGQLDDIRRSTRKFICLNDNIDHHHPDGPNIKALLRDFYESMFPLPSQFELPPDFRNRFLHVEQLQEWKQQRWSMKMIAIALLVFVSAYSLLCFCSNWIRRTWFRRRRRAATSSESFASAECRTNTSESPVLCPAV